MAQEYNSVHSKLVMEMIQTLHTFIVQFMLDLIQCKIMLRKLDSALHGHTKVWHLGEQVVCPRYVCQGLELCGGAWLSMHMHFGRLVEQFSEGSIGKYEQQQQQQTGPSNISQAHEAKWQCWPQSYCMIYSPFVCA